MFDKKLTPQQEERHRLVANRIWLNNNIETVMKDYADQWIAVLDGGVAGNDQDVETVKQAVANRLREAVIMRVPSDPIPTPI